jgi:lipid II:glycine glycyltransferase (peptidoglycan interpeptide bridge formation enzyme)
MTKYADQIAKIEEQLEQQKQRLRNLKAQETKQQRKDDARRKILYGAAFLALINDMTVERQQTALDNVHKRIRAAKDRAFLDLPPL